MKLVKNFRLLRMRNGSDQFVADDNGSHALLGYPLKDKKATLSLFYPSWATLHRIIGMRSRVLLGGKMIFMSGLGEVFDDFGSDDQPADRRDERGTAGNGAARALRSGRIRIG